MLLVYALLAFTSLFICTGFMFLSIRQYAIQTETFLRHLSELEKRLNPESNDRVVRIEGMAKQAAKEPVLPFPHKEPKGQMEILEDMRGSAEEMGLFVD